MQLWLRESLKRRLHKSAWMRPETEKHFPFREFYVQLEWQKKVHHVLYTEKVTLHSIHELIEQMTEQTQQAADKLKGERSVIIEGKIVMSTKYCCFGLYMGGSFALFADNLSKK